jgi:dihydroflavonol-4-reductase
MGDGSLKMGAPNIGIGVVDVRDVAEAHFQAGFRPEAEGRHINCARGTSFLEMARTLHQKYGNTYPVPNKPIPRFLLLLVGPMLNKSITRKYIRNNVNKTWKADNSKSIKSLGINYRPMEETLNDTFQLMIDEGMVKKK